MTLPPQVETVSPDEGVAQPTLHIAPQSIADPQKSSVTPEEDTVPDGLASAKAPSQPDDGSPSDPKLEAPPGAAEPGDLSEALSKETYDEVEKIYDYLLNYINGDVLEANENHRCIGTGSFVMRAHEKRLPLKSRIRHNETFSFMFQEYFRLVNDRLSALESKASMDEKDVDEDKTKNSLTMTIPRERRVTWVDFKRKDEKKRSADVHALDVLIGDAIIPHKIWARFHSSETLHLRDIRRAWFLQDFIRVGDEENTTDTAVPVHPPQSTEGEYPALPDRIRINGGPLLKLLEKVLEVELHKENSPLVLLRPFKLLVQYEQDIRSVHTQLRKKFEPTAVAEQAMTSSPDENPESSQNSDQTGISLDADEVKLLEEYGSEQAYKELCCLIEFMDRDLRPLGALRSGFVEKVYYSELWHIFTPGEVVITRQEPVHAYRVLYVTGGRPYLCPPTPKENQNEEVGYQVPPKESDFVVLCYQVHYDGEKFGPVTQNFTVTSYNGRRSVRDLPIYPLRLAEDPSIKEKLLSNGRKYLRVSKGTHLQYRGPNLHEGEEIDSQVVIDFKTAIWDSRDKDQDWKYKTEFGVSPPNSASRPEVVMVSAGGCQIPDCCENDRVFNDLDLDHRRMEEFVAKNALLTTNTRNLDDDPDKVPEEDIIILPSKIFAFVLKDRKWAVIDINHVEFADTTDQPRDRGWNSLVLPHSHKKMVYSLVQAHFRHRSEETQERYSHSDLIRGKGKGLIILLHGAPGVGKTSTAECVAELCDLPLYPITCGDLGITASEVESRLKYIFTQAQKWKCVLLLDEASSSFLQIFLRVLEYYQGILFLTTNRVGKIDEAFRSRVHISLYYPPLDKRTTLKIFAENMKLAEMRGKDAIVVKKDDISRFANNHYKENDPQHRWNGRQIRNAFHIAVAMAEDHAAEKNRKAAEEGKPKEHTPVLKASYFRLVEEASTRFDDYLHEVHGMGKQDLAKQNSTRRDDWNRDRRDRKSRPKGGNRRRQVESSESSVTDSSEADTYQYSSTASSEESSENSEEEYAVQVQSSYSSDEELSMREKQRRLDRKKGSSNKERKSGSGEARKDGTRTSRKGRDSRRS
ncbi:uncharacterized protein N7496_005252 [Penicillium cataractarum]|uniref:AAA+ ATPase domain-containing protein n=1 Tax=Penicillium cataractarum TaxID=2100454 RepID=A0A9W9VD93_9EURO|nr:uncharacterized protein N7496_005252 [Penicillium cataractarum]KAJ5377843.1 hypothetical protein N7496_005252 [Penicillium cataractarum]